jgi:chitin disaccharide deacetylase
VTRTLIVNADDFGRTDGVNRGIVRAHEDGIVTSASLMVRQPAAEAAAAYARDRETLGVGLHVDLGEWQFDGGEWNAVYETGAAATAREVRAQVDAFEELVGRQPSHLDSHQHVHLREPARAAVAAEGERLGVPVRHLTPAIRYCGAFYGQTETGEPWPEAITFEALERLVRALPPGVTELCCHPAEPDDLASSYREERRLELEVLCDPLVRRVLTDEGVRLTTFAEASR